MLQFKTIKIFKVLLIKLYDFILSTINKFNKKFYDLKKKYLRTIISLYLFYVIETHTYFVIDAQSNEKFSFQRTS